VQGFFAPQGICLGTNGDIYVADPGGNRIIKLSPAIHPSANPGADTDGDGIPDWAEFAPAPYLVGVDDRLVDSDGDGQSNSAEYVAGTDPLDPHSVFKVQIHQTPEGEIVLAWETSLNRAYQVQYSEDFKEWTNLGGCPAAYGRMQTFTTSRCTNTRGYRVLVKQF
jgi:hypothetical protein